MFDYFKTRRKLTKEKIALEKKNLALNEQNAALRRTIRDILQHRNERRNSMAGWPAHYDGDSTPKQNDNDVKADDAKQQDDNNDKK